MYICGLAVGHCKVNLRHSFEGHDGDDPQTRPSDADLRSYRGRERDDVGKKNYNEKCSELEPQERGRYMSGHGFFHENHLHGR